MPVIPLNTNGNEDDKNACCYEGGFLMEIEIRKATLEDIELLMEWRMEVLHEVFSIPSSKNTDELEQENRAYYQRALAQEEHIACFACMEDKIIGCGGICFYREMPSRIIQPGNAPI